MQPIEYTLIQHRNESRILVKFEINIEWNNRIKKVPGVRWSKSLQAWTIPDNNDNRKKCGLTLQNKIVTTANSLIKPLRKPIVFISINNKIELEKFLNHLRLKAYSPSTIRTYKGEFAQLLQLLGKVNVQKMQSADIQRYLLFCFRKGASEHAIHSKINALKFYFEQILHKEKMFFEIPRPKRPLQLPKLLSETELARLFNAIQNKKHKAMLFTAYSAGLRLSEIVHLKISDIDSKRMQIFVQRAKGKKDRYVNLSPVLLDILRKYIQTYKPRPKLFYSKVYKHKHIILPEQFSKYFPMQSTKQEFEKKWVYIAYAIVSQRIY